MSIVKKLGLGVALLALGLPWPPSLWALPGPNPAPRVLLLYTPADWVGTNAIDNVMSILTSTMVPAPVVDECPVTDAGGEIAPALTACGDNLANYCQIWDPRFVFNTSGGPYQDYITAADQALYTQFLQSGGRLFIQGETTAFHPRNDGLIQFLNTISNGGPITYPSNCKSNCCCSIFPLDPFNFNSTPNTMTPTTTGDPGLFDSYGSGRPLAELGTQAETLGFLPPDMTTGAGRLMVEMDANFFKFAVGSMPAGNVQFIQNAYTWLGSGCDQRFQVTKATSVGPPSTVCIGDNFSYTLCVENMGAFTLNAGTIYDTLPSCISYVSSSSAPSLISGNFVEWNVGTVPVGSQVCVTVTVKAVSLPPCP